MDVLGEYDSSNELLRSYVTPGIDENISLYDGANTYYYMRDGLGSVRAVYDASEALQNSYEYESFGQALSASENVAQPYRFTGRAWDGNASLHYYRTRYYNPSLGVFTQKDRLWAKVGVSDGFTGAAFNASTVGTFFPLQAFAANNPVTRIDQYGRLSITVDPGHYECSNLKVAATVAEMAVNQCTDCREWFRKNCRENLLDARFWAIVQRTLGDFLWPMYTSCLTPRTIYVRPSTCEINPVELASLLIHEVAHHCRRPCSREGTAVKAQVACDTTISEISSGKDYGYPDPDAPCPACK